MTNPTHPMTSPGWFGHPRQLARLFTTEMWERLGFYGMRALLVLYLTKHFVLGDHAAAGIYGGYMALVYLTPLLGGLVADQYLGSKRSVRFGAILMAIGYFSMAFGGTPAQPWIAIDGQHVEITRSGFHDGPTSAAAETRGIVLHGQPLTVRNGAGESIALVDAAGHTVRTLPKDTEQGATHSEARLTLLLAALALVSVGNGFFKPNISTMVGALYAQGDRRRDAGFTIFYMGINLGSIIGQVLCPLLADTIGWGAAFSLSGAGMLVAWALVTFDSGRLDGFGETPQREGGDRKWLIGALAIAAVPLFALLFVQLMHTPEPVPGAGLAAYIVGLPLMGKLLFFSFALGIPVILGWSWLQGSRQEFQMMLAAMVLITFNTVFWALFEQAGSSLTLFADRNTDRSVFGLFTMSAPQTQNFNSLAIVLLAPVVSMLWGWLAKRNLEPSIPVKFGLALVGVGAGFLLLVLGTHFADGQYRVALWWLAGLYVIHSLAELLISPVGLSMITKLAIPRVVGLMMGMWFLSMSMGEYVAGMVAQVASVKTVGGQVTDPALSLATYVSVFTQIGWTAIVIGGVLLIIAKPLKKLMHGVV
ncbi:MAG: peptide MFS transporter [Sphingomonadales bacterium]|nr:peptide MFS transporter [Sphingomonadales bacterium]